MATLAQLRTSARQRADMELGPGQDDTDHFITNSELNGYINSSIKELYDLLIKSDGDYYLTSTTVTTTSATEYDLPATFYKLKSLDDENGRPFLKFNFKDRYKSGLRYRVRGSKIVFNDQPGANRVCTLWYHPKFTDLTLDGDTFDGINGWEEYVIVDAAIKMLTKEESDTSTLYAQKVALKARIEEMADDRDAGEPDSITDLRYSTHIDARGWEWDD